MFSNKSTKAYYFSRLINKESILFCSKYVYDNIYTTFANILLKIGKTYIACYIRIGALVKTL